MGNSRYKFRAWDGDEMWSDQLLSISMNGQLIFDSGSTGDKVLDFPLMQYTGLKDKNGVEIYEGDILQKHCLPQKGFVEFKDGCFVINYGDDSNFIASRNVFEVIGNIHKSPELLEK